MSPMYQGRTSSSFTFESWREGCRVPSAVRLNTTLHARIFGGPLPRPAALYLCFQRETEKSPDDHDCCQQPNALKRQRRGNCGDNICADEQFKSEQDATSNVGTVTRISRTPIARARPSEF